LLEVEPTGQRGRVATRSDQYIIEAERLTSSTSLKAGETEQ